VPRLSCTAGRGIRSCCLPGVIGFSLAVGRERSAAWSGVMRALVIAVGEGLESSYRNRRPLIALCSFCKVTELPLIARPSNLHEPLQKVCLLRERAVLGVTPSSVLSAPPLSRRGDSPFCCCKLASKDNHLHLASHFRVNS